MTSAQKSDGFFRNYNNDIYENRDIFNPNTTIPADGITIYGFGEPVPLGSGLLILTVAGAGYTVLRRKHLKGLKAINGLNAANAIILSLTLLLMPSCKQKVETVNTSPQAPTNGIHITLNVGDGSKVIVDPDGIPYATVTFEENDIIYVGNNGAYCGYLEHDGTNFTGTVNPSSEDDYLHFYFMGNKGGTVSVNFAANCGATTGQPYSFSKSGNGKIKLHAKSNTERWAILLPQEEITTAMAYINGTGYSTTSAFTIPEITSGMYYNNDDIEVNLDQTYDLVGEFTIKGSGDKVSFSKGNLQYQASTNTWSFAENQYDIIGYGNENISSDYDGWIDMFGWGTSGYDHGSEC